jgi:uncharacterized protein (DUF885 family)
MKQTKTTAAFEGLLSRYFERLLQEVPTFATINAGLPSGEGRLGSLSLEFQQRREAHRQATLKTLETMSPLDLSNEQHLDRLALRSHLLRECEDYARGRHTLDPGAADHVLNILLHELMRGDDEPRRAARNLRSLLRQAPGFLDEAAAAIDRPERVWLAIMQQAVEGSPALLDGVRTLLAQNIPEPHDSALLEATQQALCRYRNRASERRAAAPGSFALGAVAMQRRVRDDLGLDYTLGQVEALAVQEAKRVGQLLQAACARHGRNRSAAEMIAEARAKWRPAKPLLELYQSESNRIATAFAGEKAVSFPKGDELRVKPVPDFLRPVIATAAYNPPGAFQKEQRGIFWVNDLSLTKNTTAEKLAEQQQHFGIPLTCAHEAYPGHHLQFVTANSHPRKWRRLFAHAVFYEGWTLWCEQMMVALRIDSSPWIKIQQLHDALWRCHRILVDLRLQTGRYTHTQAVQHLQKHVGFTRARAEADVNWYTGQPGVPMSYWLGRLENDRLRQRLMDGRGWSLQKFNDWLLSFGTLPQAWIEKYGLD